MLSPVLMFGSGLELGPNSTHPQKSRRRPRGSWHIYCIALWSIHTTSSRKIPSPDSTTHSPPFAIVHHPFIQHWSWGNWNHHRALMVPWTTDPRQCPSVDRGRGKPCYPCWFCMFVVYTVHNGMQVCMFLHIVLYCCVFEYGALHFRSLGTLDQMHVEIQSKHTQNCRPNHRFDI